MSCNSSLPCAAMLPPLHPTSQRLLATPHSHDLLITFWGIEWKRAMTVETDKGLQASMEVQDVEERSRTADRETSSQLCWRKKILNKQGKRQPTSFHLKTIFTMVANCCGTQRRSMSIDAVQKPSSTWVTECLLQSTCPSKPQIWHFYLASFSPLPYIAYPTNYRLSS